MARYIKKRKEDIGVSPDLLVFKGIPKLENVLLSIIDYDAEDMEEINIDGIDKVLPYIDKKSVTWLNVDGLHDSAIMEEIAEVFDLDILLLADVLNTTSRPRVIDFDKGLMIVLKMLNYDSEKDVVSTENISLILTKSTLISFQEITGDVFEPVRDRIRNQRKRIRNSGTDYLTFALLDIIIDNYIFIISVLGEKIESLESKLLTSTNTNLIEKINAYKQELNYLRKSIKPAREMIHTLAKMDTEIINEINDVHFKELQNNINQAQESSDSYREILSDQLNIYHTTMSSKLNDIMKFLTVFSVIFIPLTFIAGIYGTNFDFLPELHYKYSYFIMLGVMALVAIGMLMYFKNKKWF